MEISRYEALVYNLALVSQCLRCRYFSDRDASNAFNAYVAVVGLAALWAAIVGVLDMPSLPPAIRLLPGSLVDTLGCFLLATAISNGYAWPKSARRLAIILVLPMLLTSWFQCYQHHLKRRLAVSSSSSLCSADEILIVQLPSIFIVFVVGFANLGKKITYPAAAGSMMSPPSWIVCGVLFYITNRLVQPFIGAERTPIMLSIAVYCFDQGLPRVLSRLPAYPQVILPRSSSPTAATAGACRVVLITGATSGLGVPLATKLYRDGYKMVIACRSLSKGEEIVAEMEADVTKDSPPTQARQLHKIELLLMDVGDINSVAKGAQAFKTKYKQLDVLILNAGVYPFVGYRWLRCIKNHLLSPFNPGEVVDFYSTGGDFLIEPKQTIAMKNPDIGEVFATNVLGHMLLVEQLKEVMVSSAAASGESARVVWTGSRSTRRFVFQWDDPQCLRGEHPYRNSKYAVDLLVRHYNNALMSRGVSSFTCCPGAVFTKLTPQWLHYLQPLFRFMGLFVSNFCRIRPEEGCEVQYRLSTIDLATTRLDPKAGKYEMEWNKLALEPLPMITDEGGEQMYNYCLSLLGDEHAKKRIA